MSEALAGAIEKIGVAFNEYKAANDARLAEIAKRGTADPLLDDKLKRIDEVLDAQAEMKSRLEQAETRAARPGGAGAAGNIVLCVCILKLFCPWKNRKVKVLISCNITNK